VSKVTLSFSNESLEAEWSRLVEPRQRALWLRSLLSSVLFQALRHASDLVELGGRITRVTIAARLALSVAELTLYALARVELVAPRQAWIATNATVYGMVELAVTASHLSPRIKPSAWLFVTYGVAWFVVPKMSALQFFPACCGSLFIVVWWLSMALATTRTGRAVLASAAGGADPQAPLPPQLQVATSWCDVTAGLALSVPVIVLFNVVAYSSEKSVKERFVLRSALSHEHNHDVRLALLSEGDFLEKVRATILSRKRDTILSRKPARAADDGSDTSCSSASGAKPPPFFSQAAPHQSFERRAALALVPCALLAALGWFPSAQRLISEWVMRALGGVDAAWAALTHVAGLTLFMLVLTRRLRFGLITPLVCLSLLWLTAQLWETRWVAAWRRPANSPPLAAFCDERCGGTGAPRGDRLFYWERSARCAACFADGAKDAASPRYSLASALRLVGSLVLASAFLCALGLFAKCVRLFARLVAFARRTLFLYPHLAKDLVGPGASPGDSETLKKLVSTDRLPRLPGGAAAVAGAALRPSPRDAVRDAAADAAADADADDDDARTTAVGPSRPSRRRADERDEPTTDDTDHSPARRLPTLAIGTTDRVCSFCSRDATSRARRATHSVPVCSDWARWYLWRAEAAQNAMRLKSEIGAVAADGKPLLDAVEKPCCDFASLALDRADLARENRQLRDRLAALETALRASPSSLPPSSDAPRPASTNDAAALKPLQ